MIEFDQNNITNNFVKLNSGFWMEYSLDAYVNFSIFDKNDATSRICPSSASIEYKNSIFTNNKIVKNSGYPGMFTVGNGNSLTFDNYYFSGNNQGSDSLFGTNSRQDSITIKNSYILNLSTIYSGDGQFEYENKTISLTLSLDPANLCSFEEILIYNSNTIIEKSMPRNFFCLLKYLV